MNDTLLTTILGIVIGIFLYLTNINRKLKKANEEKARLETEANMSRAIFDFTKATETSNDAEENYKNIRDKYLNTHPDDDGDGGKSA